MARTITLSGRTGQQAISLSSRTATAISSLGGRTARVVRGRGVLSAVIGVGAATLVIFVDARSAASPPLGADVTGVASAVLAMSADAAGVAIAPVIGAGHVALTLSAEAVGATFAAVTGTGSGTLALTGAAEGLQSGIGAATLALDAAGAGTALAPITGAGAPVLALTAAATGAFTAQGVGSGASTLSLAATGTGAYGDAGAGPALPTPTVTATTATLASVWPTVTGGDVLGLAPGAYTGLPTRSALLASTVTITSTDPNNLAAFPAGLKLLANNNRNITLQGLNLSLAAPATETEPGLYVSGGSDITVRGCQFGGQIVSGKRWGYGVNAVGTTRLTLDGNVGSTLKRGFSVQNIVGGSITDNDLFDIRVDGIDLGLACRDLEVSRNHIRSGPSVGGDHADGLQFITTLTAVSRNVTIENNVFEGSVANRPQGIFGGAKSGGQRLSGITARGNLLVNTSYTGIGVVGVDDMAIEDNILLFVSDPDPLAVPTYSSIHTYAGTGVTVTGNQATRFLLDATTAASGNTSIAAVSQATADAAVAAWRAEYR